MAYTAEELLQYARDKIMASRLSTWSSQNDISYWRGLHHKYDQQLVDVVTQYEEKIQELVERYKQNLTEMDDLIKGTGLSIVDFKEDMRSLVAKALRLAEKYWAVRYEIEGRQKGFFVRKPVGTIYYIDLTNGNDTNDGLSITTAWKTLEKYTSVTVRSAGDIGYVRANTAQVMTATISCDESGNSNNYIKIVGCDAVNNDPWGDASNVKPILDGNALAYQLLFSTDRYWWVERVRVQNYTEGNGGIYFYTSHGGYAKDCECESGVATFNGAGFKVVNEGPIVFDGCSAKDNGPTGENFNIYSCQAVLKNCVANAGTVRPTGCGLGATLAIIDIIDSSFGQTTAHATADFYYLDASTLRIRNTAYNSVDFRGIYCPTYFFSEDNNKSYGAGIQRLPVGTVEKDTAVKTGGAAFSCKMTPNGDIGLNEPLHLGVLREGVINPFMVNLSAGVQKTLTVKVRANGWTAFPTAAQLYIEWSYYNNASTADRETVKTTAVISQADTWTDFSVTITPQRDGIVYGNVYLKKYEANKNIWVNGEVEVS